MEWRKKFGIDNLLDWQVPEILKKYIVGGYFGYTKTGMPIWYELPGRQDVKGEIFSVAC